MDLCKKFMDVILTDYIDGEIDKVMKEEIEQHLLSCSSCRELLKDMREALVAPLKETSPEAVPEDLWSLIKERIEAGERSANPFKRWLEAFSFSNFAPALSVIVLLILVGSSVMNIQRLKEAKEKEQGEYLVSILDSTNIFPESDNSDLGTSIEEYFL